MRSENNIEFSVIIVAYNCLSFLTNSLKGLLNPKNSLLEIIVVDNNSNDLSSDFIEEYFPTVIFIKNHENVGFGRACNQGIAIAKGNYYLMLNPDTIVPEDLTEKVLRFMYAHPNCGAMGVKMVDGHGNFLPESKRGLPTLFRSFCKFSGLTALFYRSKWFSGYYLGHLSNDDANEVEVLSGAFMVLKSQAVKELGAFNERFFMYGEDIDISWRYFRSKFKNYYNPNITIVHFKGESTVKDKKYRKVFFGAMKLFYEINYTERKDIIVRPLVLNMIEFVGFISGMIGTVSKCFKRSLSVYPFKNDFIVVSNNKEFDVLKLNHIALGEFKGCFNLDEVDGIPVSQFACFIDLSTLKPSQGLEFIKRQGALCKRIVWIGADGKMFYLPVSSSNRTIIVSQ